MADLDEVRTRANELMTRHLSRDWVFRFDTAKTRAGLCNFTKRTISVSKYLAARSTLADVEQTLLHEIAHALAGPDAGHGEVWLVLARSIGYTGSRTHDGPVAREFARWHGECPNGHEVVRFRRPTRPMSCGKCTRRFDRRFLIMWRERSPEELAASAAGAARS
ncbi:SprT-like domain-containing protein [Gulosibacter sediminis]|uniref:SprT-like domain-containing protein n=1 Tax=Gulosibacter sediminis TaxID=1729695 RepID=UPI001865C4E3|nr:SprT-like domain-containing protein [Gulosibacter sediminis]